MSQPVMTPEDISVISHQLTEKQARRKVKMPCIVCGKLYNSTYFYHKHIALHRLCPVETVSHTTCGYCGKQFENATVYIDHMSIVARNVKNAKFPSTAATTDECDMPLERGTSTKRSLSPLPTCLSPEEKRSKNDVLTMSLDKAVAEAISVETTEEEMETETGSY